MEQKNIADILLKYELGISSEQENQLIESWYNSQPQEDWFFDSEQVNDKKEKILSHIHEDRHPSITKRSSHYRIYLGLVAAAAILLITFLFFFNPHTSDNANQVANFDQFTPGQNKAILKLDDGSSFILNGSKNGVKILNGRAVYLDGAPITTTNLQSKILTVEVPKGGQYQVNLPDGSKVWLNAASTLKYPLEFADQSREVSLTGEAYFEVTKNSHKPFFVRSRDQQVEVLGTVFNIDSYNDREFVETTLLQGSVHVNQLRLSPGQRSLVSAASSKILPANIEAATAWKKGYFLFDNEPLVQILSTLSRWYDVNFEFAQPHVKQLSFWGSIDKNQSLAKTLAFFESTNQVKFDYQDGKIRVHAK